MTLPDEGQVDAYTEEEMTQLLDLFEKDKNQLTKNQKAAVARYNFKKGKGEPITFKGQAPPPPKAGETPAPTAQATARPGGIAIPPDVLARLPPEIQKLAAKEPGDLTKDERIAIAKAKSQAVKAMQAAKDAEGGTREQGPKGPSPEALARDTALASYAGKALDARFSDAVEGWTMMVDAPYATVKPERFLDVVTYATNKLGFHYLRNLTAADYPQSHLEVVYNLYNMDKRAHLALRVKVPREMEVEGDLPRVPSIVHLHQGADWLERETYDLFGIHFEGHPYLKRIMMPEGWTGYPLRKDYDRTKEQFIGLDEHGADVVSFRSEDGW